MKLAALILAVTLLSSRANAQCTDSYSASGSAVDWEVQWTVRGDMIDFVVSATTTGWVGIGFSGNQFMTLSDIIVGAADTSNPVLSFVSDRSSGTTRNTPIADASQDLTMTMAEVANGRTTIYFTRARVTGDSSPIDIALNDPIYFLWATGDVMNINNQDIQYHATSRGASDSMITLPSAGDCPAIAVTSTVAFSAMPDATTSVAIFPQPSTTSNTLSLQPSTATAPTTLVSMPLPSPSPTQMPDIECIGSYSAAGSVEFSVQWTVRGDFINFTVSAQTTGWLGIGFSRNGFMTDSDVVVGASSADNTGFFVSDRWVGSSRTPPVVDNQDVTMTMAEQMNGQTTIAFTRIRVTDETFPIDVPLDEPIRLLWAAGTANDQDGQIIDYHGTVRRGASGQMIQFPSAVECPFIEPPTTNEPSTTTEPLPTNVVCEGGFSSRSTSWMATWTVYDNDIVAFTVSAETTNWVAIGFSLDQFMPATDIVVGAANPDNPTTYFVSDRYASGRSPPSVDTSQDIGRQSADLVDGVTTISFIRQLNTNDRNGDIDLDQQFYVLWAIGGNVNNYQAEDINNIARHDSRGTSGLLTLCMGDVDTVESDSGIVSVAGSVFVLIMTVASLLVTILLL